MLPSKTDSQSAGFNLLPHVTVRGVRIELTHTGIQNRRPTLDHPPVVSSLECGSNAPLRVFSAALSPGQLSRAPCRADLGSRTQLAGVRNRSDHHDHLIGRAVGVGIEPTESALTVRSVYQHTSPTRWVANPGKMRSATAVHGRPPCARSRTVTPLRIVREQKAHVRLRCARRESNPIRRVKNPLLDQ